MELLMATFSCRGLPSFPSHAYRDHGWPLREVGVLVARRASAGVDVRHSSLDLVALTCAVVQVRVSGQAVLSSGCGGRGCPRFAVQLVDCLGLSG